MPAFEPVSVRSIREVQGRLTGTVLRTPLVRLNFDDSPAEIFLKQLQKGVWTASAGNGAQEVAWNARQLGVEGTVVVPEGAPEAKIAAGKPVVIEHTPSFVDGIGAPFLFPGMWELASQLVYMWE